MWICCFRVSIICASPAAPLASASSLANRWQHCAYIDPLQFHKQRASKRGPPITGSCRIDMVYARASHFLKLLIMGWQGHEAGPNLQPCLPFPNRRSASRSSSKPFWGRFWLLKPRHQYYSTLKSQLVAFTGVLEPTISQSKASLLHRSLLQGRLALNCGIR